MQKHGPWQIVRSDDVYRDPWITVRRDEVIRPDGKPGTHSVIGVKPGACVLAMGEEGYVYLTEEFHYAVGRVTIEAVSGGIEPDEDALETAKRELREELGIEAAQWVELGMCDPFTASVVSPTKLFVARQLAFGDHAPEGTEQIRRVKMTFAEAIENVMAGRITHAPSALLILKAAVHFQSLQSSPAL